MNASFDLIFFDFNGTLLNDLDRGYDCIRQLCIEYHVTIPSQNLYLETFGFPVHQFYLNLGFKLDHHAYQKLSERFMELYHRDPLPDLFERVPALLERLSSMGLRLAIISAYRQDRLNRLLELRGIQSKFEWVSGLQDDLATSKEIRLQEAMQVLQPQNPLFIGDTLHDLDVARSVGIPCHLIASGHTSYDRLCREGEGSSVYLDLEEWEKSNFKGSVC